MNKKVKLILAIMILSLVLAGCADQIDKDSFAKCLKESGVKMYGAYWCGACANQKQMFGKAWKNVDYVECSMPNKEEKTQACIEGGISTYPTWKFPNGDIRTGVLALEELGKVSGCQP